MRKGTDSAVQCVIGPAEYLLGAAHPVDVQVEGEEELLPVHGPHLDGLVVGGGYQGLAVAGEVDAADGPRVGAEHRRLALPVGGGGGRNRLRLLLATLP